MDAIHCQLITTTFSKIPIYEALYYTWGRDERAQHIVVNGYDFRVGQNLYDALYHLRHAEVDRTLWVDAICINQSHIAERNSQVEIMDIIYSRAQTVLVWLDFPECNHVIGLRARQDYEPDLSEIQSVSHHPYWERLWILQEIGLGREVEFVVYFITGVRNFTWEQFHETWDNHLSPNMRAVLSLRDNRYTENPRLEVLLEKFRYAKCAEWRDKVFGLLGLATDNLKDALKVDYEISRLDLFANLIDFFYKAPALKDDPKGNSAWDRQVWLIKFSQLLLQILGYDAVDGSDWPHVFSDPWRAFEVRAYLVSTIMQVGPSCTDIISSPKVEKKWRQGFGDHYPDFKELGLLRELYNTFHWSMSEWEQWDQHKIRNICSKMSFGFLQNSRGYREMPRAEQASVETTSSPPLGRVERRVFLGSNHVLGFVPSHVGRPRVCTREQGLVSFENLDSERALGLWLDIDVLCSLTY
ncbi:heterokaryon incompatibility protein-domain-containing protein [Xylaria arbuscula]|nr:heterokaryon incompatibility protein-domain-containing protein [Xylaria arbuscula]